jgi:cephalosporin hydroxylase
MMLGTMLLIAEDASWRERLAERIERTVAVYGRRIFARGFQKTWEYSAAQWATKWLGVTVVKKPLDLFVYQEIIFETRPQVIVETGSAKGGSALFFASLFDLLGEGQVVSIDVNDTASRTVSHSRVTFFVGSSVSDVIVDEVRQAVGARSCMVSLDSAHTGPHVLHEMELYGDLVSPGKYMVVEDTGIRGDGPASAVRQFLRSRSDFRQDRTREKFMVTSCRGGFLRKEEA